MAFQVLEEICACKEEGVNCTCRLVEVVMSTCKEAVVEIDICMVEGEICKPVVVVMGICMIS